MSESSVQQFAESGVGSILRAHREARGISLDEAAHVTRISKSYLDAIEREDFTRLPNPAYCKGFIRIYASYLELSGDEMVASYERSVHQALVQSDPVRVLEKRGSDRGARRRIFNRWLLPLVLISAILVLSMLIDTDQRPPLKRDIPATLPLPAVQPVISSAQNNSSPASIQVTTPPSPSVEQSAATPASTAQSDALIFRLKINQDCWLNIDVDGRFSQQYDLKAGDMIEWKAENIITLDIGNAGGVEGDLNGKPLPSFGQPGKKVHVVLRPDGVVGQ